jgi:hypothetical protein
MRGLLIPALCLPLAACDGLEILAGNESPSKAHYEAIAALTDDDVAVASELSVTPEPVSVPTKQCVEVFRINRCDADGNETEWYYK